MLKMRLYPHKQQINQRKNAETEALSEIQRR